MALVPLLVLIPFTLMRPLKHVSPVRLDAPAALVLLLMNATHAIVLPTSLTIQAIVSTTAMLASTTTQLFLAVSLVIPPALSAMGLVKINAKGASQVVFCSKIAVLFVKTLLA